MIDVHIKCQCGIIQTWLGLTMKSSFDQKSFRRPFKLLDYSSHSPPGSTMSMESIGNNSLNRNFGILDLKNGWLEESIILFYILEKLSHVLHGYISLLGDTSLRKSFLKVYK